MVNYEQRMSHLETQCGLFHLAGEITKPNTTNLLNNMVNGTVVGYGISKVYFRTTNQEEKLKDVTKILSKMDECGVPVSYNDDVNGVYVFENKRVKLAPANLQLFDHIRMIDYLDEPGRSLVKAEYLRNCPNIPFTQEMLFYEFNWHHQVSELMLYKPTSLLLTSDNVLHISSVDSLLVDGKHTCILFNSLDDFVNNLPPACKKETWFSDSKQLYSFLQEQLEKVRNRSL